MPGERTRVEAKCQGNAGECRGMQGNDSATYRSGCKLPGESRVMQGNARGTYGSRCIAPDECRKLTGECKGVI